MLRNIISSSSASSIYGNAKGLSSEKRVIIPDPYGYYGYAKSKGVDFVNFMINPSKFNDLKYGILRYFNVAGASRLGKYGETGLTSHVATHLIKKFSRGSICWKDLKD